MKPSRFTDSQIMAILKQAAVGTPAPTRCREHSMSSATFYKWRVKFGGMDVPMMTRLKELVYVLLTRSPSRRLDLSLKDS